ncbi:T9SS type A sorting domain-containing protein [Winogradskyella sp.]|uniref:T9SS type A sorting domain-containing protein n=1 Tax=Winogradskyella sp. TaxID=1883156 RepID=UPI002616C35B|nr:T9SS type A sorting domain-containing protein [Winogradskyella sp.]
MKHNYFSKLMISMALLLVVQTYSTAQNNIEDVVLNGQAFKKITGTISVDETLDNSSLWIIEGIVEVAANTTLTITEGTQIFAETAGTRLEVNQLGLVDWQGTATNPIVFNSLANAPGQGPGDTTRGQWSGIGIEGAGGTDNSGTIRYVRLMYPGSDDDAFQFTNGGDQTVAEYIQVFRPGDNGIRINNGTINFKYLVSTDPIASEAGIRWSDNWDGNGQFWVVNMLEGSEAIQGREGNGLLSNVTITGPAFNDASAAFEGIGFRIRNGGTAQIYNAVVTGVDVSIRFSNGSEDGVTNGVSFFRNSASFENDPTSAGGAGFHSTAETFNPEDSAYVPTNDNSTDTFPIVDSYVGTSTTNSTAAGALDAFFTDVNYVGAVQNGNDWTEGWTLNLDGTLRTLSVNGFDIENIEVYPNPVVDELTINSEFKILNVAIYNILGRKVYENLSFINDENKINMSQFQQGIYFLQLSSGDATQTLKIIKR